MKACFVLIITFLLFSCNNRNENTLNSFIVTSIENGIIVSAKSDFKDTLFYEHRFPDSTRYSFILLSKQQNEKLRKLIENVRIEKESKKIELSSGQEVFIIDNGKVQFYINDFHNKSENYRQLNYFFKETSLNMFSTKERKNFWNIGKIIPPPNPPKSTNVKFKNNGY
jgi:hypothetical protein